MMSIEARLREAEGLSDNQLIELGEAVREHAERLVRSDPSQLPPFLTQLQAAADRCPGFLGWACWAEGIAEHGRGRMAQAVPLLRRAAGWFRRRHAEHTAARVELPLTVPTPNRAMMRVMISPSPCWLTRTRTGLSQDASRRNPIWRLCQKARMTHCPCCARASQSAGKSVSTRQVRISRGNSSRPKTWTASQLRVALFQRLKAAPTKGILPPGSDCYSLLESH